MTSPKLTPIQRAVLRAITARYTQNSGRGVLLQIVAGHLKKNLTSVETAANVLEKRGLIQKRDAGRGIKHQSPAWLYIPVFKNPYFLECGPDGIQHYRALYADGYEPNNHPPEIAA